MSMTRIAFSVIIGVMDDATRVKEAIDIVAVIGRSIQLKKAGRNFLGLCPFHGEHSPSFNVNPERQIFKCFGCNEGGDVISFVMKREGLSFAEALKVLADEAGITLTQLSKNKAQYDVEDRLYSLLELSAKFYHHLLIEHNIGSPGREYIERRGFKIGDSAKPLNKKSVASKDNRETSKIIIETEMGILEHFMLGFSPDNWDSLGSFLIKKGYSVEEMMQAGVVVKKENGRGFYDMFRNRIMFPLFSKTGKIVGFSGRVLDNSKPKYINTAETVLFHKREFLFGFYQARESIRKNDTVIIVEGEMDMLSSFKAGVENVVAVKGSSLTGEHLNLLSKVCHTLLLCFDADKAGDAAQVRAIHDAMEKGFEVKVIQLPEGKDADECIRKDVQIWLGAIEQAVPFYDFMLMSSIKRHSMQSGKGKSDIVKEVIPFLKSIGDVVVRAHYIQRLADAVGVEERVVLQAMKDQASSYNPPQSVGPSRMPYAPHEELVEKKKAVVSTTQKVTTERYFLAMLVRIPSAATKIGQFLDSEALNDNGERLLYTLMTEYFSAREERTIEAFLAQSAVVNSEIRPFIDELFLVDVPEQDEDLKRELITTTMHLKRQWLKTAIRNLTRAMKQAQFSDSVHDISSYSTQLSNLLAQSSELELESVTFSL